MSKVLEITVLHKLQVIFSNTLDDKLINNHRKLCKHIDEI